MYKLQVQVQYKYSKPQSLEYPETSSLRYSKRRSDGRNSRWRFVIKDTLGNFYFIGLNDILVISWMELNLA